MASPDLEIEVEVSPAAAQAGKPPPAGPAGTPFAAAAAQLPADFHGISLKGVDPLLATAIPPPAAFKSSPHYPLIFTQNPFAAGQVSLGEAAPNENLPWINTRAYETENDMGRCKIEIHVRGVKSSQAEKFRGKKRFVHTAIQARLTRPVVAGDLCLGQELFNEAAVPVWLSEALLTLGAKALSATTRVCATSKPRFFMNPVLASCQLINVARAGEEPGLWDAKEDVRLMLPDAVDAKGAPLSSEARRKWCDVPANIEGAVFSPGLVYTFHFWQHYADFGKYRLNLGFLNLDLAPLLHRSPLQLTCKDVGSGSYAFSLLVWHERALYGRINAAGDAAGGDDDATAAADQAARLLRGSGSLTSRLLSGLSGVLGSGRQGSK